MKLGILLSLGSSLKDQKQSGQDERFVKYYLNRYNKHFDKTYIFSYLNEEYKLPERCFLIVNKRNINRFLYCFLIPMLHYKKIKEIDVFRVMQLTGVIPAIIIKIIFKKPFIVTYGYDYANLAKLEGQKIRPVLTNILEKLIFKFASMIIVTNKTIEFRLKNKYHSEKIKYLPNGVDSHQFKPKFFPNPSSGWLTILFVGRLVKQKNLINLIKAVSLLSKEYSLRLMFVGQGPLKNQLETLAHCLGVNLKIVDLIPHKKIVSYYQNADIFVLPSFMEGHPKALLEAMACGLPCILGQYPGSEEFVDRKEIITTDFSVHEISNNLKNLLTDNKLRKNLIINALKKIKKDFNIEKLIGREIELLRNV